jgi:hypothetical protein
MLEDSITLKIILIVLLLINCGLTITLVSKTYKSKKEGWDNGFGTTDNTKPNFSATYIKPMENDDDYGQKTYAGCSCANYGVKTNINMPFNDDSNLYAKTKYQGW